MTAIDATEVRSGVPIRITNVSKTFGEDDDHPFLALRKFNADIRAGEFVSVVGPSGCGKSTLMLMVAGLLKRSSGDVVVAGKSVTKAITYISSSTVKWFRPTSTGNTVPSLRNPFNTRPCPI